MALEGRSTDHKFRIQLRQLLTTHFDLEELRMLCFDLDVDYDDLRGEGKTNKARELVAYLGRRGRIAELVFVCSQLRPNVSWPDMSSAISDISSEPRHSSSIGQGLIALVELMQLPEVQAAGVAFRTDFRAMRRQTDVLNHYKELHNLLHELQINCYNLLVQEVRRFPDDAVAVDSIMDYELTLQEVISNWKEVAGRASFAAAETWCIQDLVKAWKALKSAIEELKPEPLIDARWILNRVLAVHPSQINTRLNATARALRLPNLVDGMAQVSDKLARVDLDLEPDKVSQFEAGVDALISLGDRLTILVDDHDRWQAVDRELRWLEANLGQDITMLEISWPDLEVKTEPLYTGKDDTWAINFREDKENLKSAIQAKNPVRVKRYFRRYSRRAGNRFHRVDTNLKQLCEDLCQVGEQLDSIMRMIQ